MFDFPVEVVLKSLETQKQAVFVEFFDEIIFFGI